MWIWLHIACYLFMVDGRFLLSSLPGFANNGLHGWAKLVRGRGDGRLFWVCEYLESSKTTSQNKIAEQQIEFAAYHTQVQIT